MSDNNKNFFYYQEKEVNWKGKNVTRRVTIAGVLNDNNVMRLGRAECSVKDCFTKKTGRMIASGRAIKHGGNQIEIQAGQIPGKIFAEAARRLI